MFLSVFACQRLFAVGKHSNRKQSFVDGIKMKTGEIYYENVCWNELAYNLRWLSSGLLRRVVR
jgi:hypothetical protein